MEKLKGPGEEPSYKDVTAEGKTMSKEREICDYESRIRNVRTQRSNSV